MPVLRESLWRDLASRPIAHRGLHACGGVGPVENTVAAAQAAIANGYGIECDVQLSADGEPFVLHDDRLDRLAGVSADVGDLAAAELDQLRLADGSAIPRLSAFLNVIAGATPLVIEIKSRWNGDLRLADAVLRAVRDYDGPLALESFDGGIVAHCAGAPCLVGLVGPSDRYAGQPPRCDFLSWNIDHLGELSANRPKLPLTTWTVRNPAQVSTSESFGAQIVFEGFRP